MNRAGSRLWMHVMFTAMCIGLGWFILWSKHRGPRAAAKPEDTTAWAQQAPAVWDSRHDPNLLAASEKMT